MPHSVSKSLQNPIDVALMLTPQQKESLDAGLKRDGEVVVILKDHSFEIYRVDEYIKKKLGFLLH